MLDSKKPIWQLQEAKAKFSELMRKAESSAQIISVHGKPTAVLIDIKTYEKIFTPKHDNLVDFMKASPLYNEEIGLSRNPSSSRNIDL